jgi:DeoR family glycerol-3-phosphate regulon repressor
MVELAHLTQIDCLFTDREPSQPFAALLREADVRCVVAEG